MDDFDQSTFEDTAVAGPSEDDPDLDDDFGGSEEYEDPNQPDVAPVDYEVWVKRLRKHAEMPKYAHPGDAGVDLRFCPENPDDEIVLSPLGRTLVPTGIAIALPPGTEAQIRARSGLSFKEGLTLINGVGTIDQGYRGEILVPMINLSLEKKTISAGTRIAQMVIQQLPSIEFTQVDTFDAVEEEEPSRGEGGFGSTGTA